VAIETAEKSASAQKVRKSYSKEEIKTGILFRQKLLHSSSFYIQAITIIP